MRFQYASVTSLKWMTDSKPVTVHYIERTNLKGWQFLLIKYKRAAGWEKWVKYSELRGEVCRCQGGVLGGVGEVCWGGVSCQGGFVGMEWRWNLEGGWRAAPATSTALSSGYLEILKLLVSVDPLSWISPNKTCLPEDEIIEWLPSSQITFLWVILK